MNISKSQQAWDAAQYADNARFVSDLGTPVLDLLAPCSGMRVLDIGCGDGVLTSKIASAGADVVAIDHSVSQALAARKLGLDARTLSALDIDFSCEFDGVFSNAVLHWIKPPEAVIDNVARALKPGGRFVGEFGGAGNVEKIKTALIAALDTRGLDGNSADPWYFPTTAEYGELLSAKGFHVEYIELIPRMTLLPGRMADWVRTLAQDFIQPISEADQDKFLDDIERDLKVDLLGNDGVWRADYVRLRFVATLGGIP